MRSLKAAAILGVSAATLFLTATPASAHTLNEAVRASLGCDWASGSYSTLHSSAVTTRGGTQNGTVHLLWSNNYQENCVVTLKSGSTHGVNTFTSATLDLGGSERYSDSGNFAHYAAVSHPAGGRCVAYHGIVYGTNADPGRGGRFEFDNCG